MEEAGTYRPFFDAMIDTLADILEKREKALKQFKEEGSVIMVEQTNKAGEAYRQQNPLLRLINDYNRDALTYWRDCGLTPSGLKKINEQSLKVKKETSLEEVLSGIGA